MHDLKLLNNTIDEIKISQYFRNNTASNLTINI